MTFGLLNMASADMGLFQNFTHEEKTKEEGIEVAFRFTYKNKPVLFVFALNCGGELYAREEYMREADLAVFHDGVYNDAEQPAENGMANRFLKKWLEWGIEKRSSDDCIHAKPAVHLMGENGAWLLSISPP